MIRVKRIQPSSARAYATPESNGSEPLACRRPQVQRRSPAVKTPRRQYSRPRPDAIQMITRCIAWKRFTTALAFRTDKRFRPVSRSISLRVWLSALCSLGFRTRASPASHNSNATPTDIVIQPAGGIQARPQREASNHWRQAAADRDSISPATCFNSRDGISRHDTT